MLSKKLVSILRTSFKLSFSTGIVVLVWSISFFFTSQADLSRMETTRDLATILFGTSSVALFIISLIFAVVGTLGWQSILTTVRQTAAETIVDVHEPLRKELFGRIIAAQGYMMAELSIDSEKLLVTNRKRLGEALKLCHDAYNQLRPFGGPAEIMALNNLVYYSTLAEDHLKENFLLKSARHLLEVGQERDLINLQLTACRTLLLYGERSERKWAYRFVYEVSANKEVPEREREEAKVILASTPEPS